MNIKIGDITKIKTGKLDANAATEKGKYPFFTCSQHALRISTYSYDCECVLVAGNGDLNVKYYNGKFDAYQRTYIIENNDDKVLYMPYLYYFMERYVDKLRNQAIGGVIKYIKLGNLTEAQVYLPSMYNQRKIVEELNKLKSIISQKREQLSELNSIIKARFVELFGDPYFNPYKWKKLKIADAVTVEPQNGLYKPQTDYIIDGTGIPILRIDCFYNGEVADWGMLKRLRCTEKDIKRYQLNDDDIVINRVNSIEYLGKCAHITGMKEKTVFESNMMRMHFDKSRFNPIYITKLLCTQYIHDQIIKHAKKAVNQASINQHDVMDFDIYLPPLNMQQEYANFVRQIAKSKAVIEKSLKELETLQASLMQKYFS